MNASSSFAHGANDVANSIAPVAAIIYIYRYGELNAEAPVNKWILAYGGFGIVLGLLCYGYKVMKTIGFKLTALSPTRGSTAGLASSLVVRIIRRICNFLLSNIKLMFLLHLLIGCNRFLCWYTCEHDAVHCWGSCWYRPCRRKAQCPVGVIGESLY
jgi:ABC-type polysaccharide/polyol phosphate export permease